jgi:hypothetical protein
MTLAGLTFACSQGDSALVSSPTATTPGASDPEKAGQSATGDVQNGPIEIQLVRVAPANESAFYAFAGGSYAIKVRREAEVYVQIWSSSSPLGDAPRLVVAWGDGASDNIHCGPCRLSHTYEREAAHVVTVALDDRAGGVTRRTFTLDTRAPVDPTPAPTTLPTPCPTTAFVGNLDGTSNSSRFENASDLPFPSLGWTNISGAARGWDLATNGALIGMTDYGNYEVQHDTGIAIRANTIYTLTVDVGYMAGWTGGNSGYRLQIGTLNGTTFTPLGSAVTGTLPYPGGSMNNPAFLVAATPQTFAAGSTVSGDRLAVRLAQTSSLGTSMSSNYFGFDNVKLQAQGCVVP